MNLIESLDAQTAHHCTLTLNIDEQKQDFGDLNSNAALILNKQLKQPPRAVAEKITKEFSHPSVEKIEIAGPGFLNFYLTNAAFTQNGQELFEQEENYFKPHDLAIRKVSIEFVSANPTGPLHFGHGRGGIIGDVLGNVLRFLGNDVTKEFYVNDAGRQIIKLGESLKARCEQLLGIDSPIPEDGYQGEYLLELARTCIAEHGDGIITKTADFFAEYAKERLMKQQEETLAKYGIHFDVWFSEKTLHESGAITEALDYLQKAGYLYQKDDATWFRSTDFGDDKDRVVKKSTGELTYVAADIAYMRNKIARGATEMIMILGHDHHSYVIRLKGILQALGMGQYPFDIILYQLVKIKEDGELVRMSKRAGRIVDLRDVIETVGPDVARFFYLHRKADAQLEFDLDLALKHTEENPVYYVQYAYVRTKSILDRAVEHSELHHIDLEDAIHLGKEEQFLLKKIASLKETLGDIGTQHQTHILTYYVHELAQAFSKYYGRNRVIDATNIQTSRGRLLLVTLVRSTLNSSLQLLGISTPERM
jgi:arginyl-tRNA synthetase